MRAGLKAAMTISTLLNGYLTESNLGNNLHVSDRDRCGSVIAFALNGIYLLSVLLEPFIPTTALEIRRKLNVPPRAIPDAFTIDLLPGHRLGPVGAHLFDRIEEEQVGELKARFAGRCQ